VKKNESKNTLGTNRISLTVNNQVYDFAIGTGHGQVDPAHTLAYTLRETLGLIGTKISCDNGACGACTVIMDEPSRGSQIRRQENLIHFSRHSSTIRPFSAVFARRG
jgi:aerobic-type carbon monoxide dehydrogenase small subunit (CoxS/CutS family)